MSISYLRVKLENLIFLMISLKNGHKLCKYCMDFWNSFFCSKIMKCVRILLGAVRSGQVLIVNTKNNKHLQTVVCSFSSNIVFSSNDGNYCSS